MNQARYPRWQLPLPLAVSGCLHLAVLYLLSRAPQPDTAPPARGAALAVLLAQPPIAALPAAVARPAVAPAAVTPAAAARATHPAIPAAQTVPATGAASVPANSANGRAGLAQAAEEAAGVELAEPVEGLLASPRYGMRMPEAIDLQYALETTAADGSRRAGTSELAVAYQDGGYSISLSGAAGLATRASMSSGVLTDDGFKPLQASSQGGEQADRRIRLNRGPAAPSSGIVHDNTSLLLQLSAIGLHDSSQLEQPVHIAVAGAFTVELATFMLAGQETIEVPFGTISTWHLAQQVAPGQVLLEVWLAPALGWYPVQIKTTAPDGAVVLNRLLKAQRR